MLDWIQSEDEQVLHWFQEHHTRFLDYNLQNITALGSTTVLVIFSLFCLGLLLLDRQCKKILLVSMIIVAAYFTTEGLKSLVGRPRPVLGHSVKTAVQSASFPSSHSSLSMTVYPVLALGLIPRAKGSRLYALVVAVLVAVVVGISRLYFGNHYLSDVIGGWLLGLFFVLVFQGVSRLVGRLDAHEPSSPSS